MLTLLFVLWTTVSGWTPSKGIVVDHQCQATGGTMSCMDWFTVDDDSGKN